jgi:hypothetical protein
LGAVGTEDEKSLLFATAFLCGKMTYMDKTEEGEKEQNEEESSIF